MNEAEKRLLHGLYYDRQNLNEPIPFEAAELRWLIRHSYAQHSGWRDASGRLQREEETQEDHLVNLGAATSPIQRPLDYLRGAGLLVYERDRGVFRIAVTRRGADIARELHHPYGRLNLLYRQHKDGLPSLWLTILISILTSFIVAHCVAQPPKKQAVSSQPVPAQTTEPRAQTPAIAPAADARTKTQGTDRAPKRKAPASAPVRNRSTPH